MHGTSGHADSMQFAVYNNYISYSENPYSARVSFHLGLEVWGGEGLHMRQNVWPLPYLLTTPSITC